MGLISMVQDCPKCGLVNPPDAQRCDCGYDFASRTVEKSYLGAEEIETLRAPKVVEILVCILVPLVGIFLGLRARQKGRHEAGKAMLLISAAMMLLAVLLRVLLFAASSRTSSG